LCKITTSLTRSLCDQTFILPLRWLKATNFPATATHTIDFGPGALSGISLLTARNFEGCGVCHRPWREGRDYNAAAVHARVAEIQSPILPGVGITLNSLCINPCQFGIQFPLWREMKREGPPIEGFCSPLNASATSLATRARTSRRRAILMWNPLWTLRSSRAGRYVRVFAIMRRFKL